MRTQFSPVGPLREVLERFGHLDLIVDYPGPIAAGDEIQFPGPENDSGRIGRVRTVEHHPYSTGENPQPFRYVVVW